MTARDFAYWLQGFFEISGESLQTIDKPKIDMIQKHLNMVFVHDIDPTYGGPEEQEKLNAIHTKEAIQSAFVIHKDGFTRPPANQKNSNPIVRC